MIHRFFYFLLKTYRMFRCSHILIFKFRISIPILTGMVMLPILLSLGSSFLFSSSTTNIKDLEAKLDMHSFDEVIVRMKNLISQDSENLTYRELLFRAYLEKGSFIKAQKVLDYIKERRQDEQTEYLEASLLFKIGELEKAETLLVEITDRVRRFSPAYLLLHQIELLKGNYDRSFVYLDDYLKLEGKNQLWFQFYGKWLESKILHTDFNSMSKLREYQKKFKNYLEDYKETFLPSHHYYYYLSFFYLWQYRELEDPFYLKNSILAIEQAITLSPQVIRYREQKSYLLFLQKNWVKLKSYYLDIIDRKILSKSEQISLLYLIALADFMQFKSSEDPMNFLLKPNSDIVYQNFFDLLKLEPEQEIHRFFLEQLLEVNRPQTQLMMIEALAKDRYVNAQQAIEMGNYSKTVNEILVSLNLMPEKIEYHEFYLKYLRKSGRKDNALEEMKILKELLEEQKVDNSLDSSNRLRIERQLETLEVKEKLLKKKLRSSLKNRYQLSGFYHSDFFTQYGWMMKPNNLRIALVYPSQESNELTDFFYMIVFTKLLHRYLNLNFYLEVQKISSDRNESIDENGNKQDDFDYYFRFDLEHKMDSIKIDYQVDDQFQTLTNRTFVSQGNDRFERILEAGLGMLSVIPKKGKIIKLEGERAIVNLGSLAEITLEDKFKILSKGQKSLSDQEYSIRQLDDYFSEILLDFKVLNQLKLGDQVIVIPQKNSDDSDSGNGN